MGFLDWKQKYNHEQTAHCERLVSDMETMEIQLYAIMKFMADAKLAPKAMITTSELIDKVREMKRNFADDAFVGFDALLQICPCLDLRIEVQIAAIGAGRERTEIRTRRCCLHTLLR